MYHIGGFVTKTDAITDLTDNHTKALEVQALVNARRESTNLGFNIKKFLRVGAGTDQESRELRYTAQNLRPAQILMELQVVIHMHLQITYLNT